MLTREKLHRGEGDLVEENPLIGLRKRTSQSEKMASKEGLSQDEKCWTIEKGVNQLLLCLNNYANLKLIIEHSMIITIMQGSKQ
jgi:hypothetical protein